MEVIAPHRYERRSHWHIDSVTNCPCRSVMTVDEKLESGQPGDALHSWRDLKAPFRRGIVVWSVIGLVLAIPELVGSNLDNLFYSISRSVGHTEILWAAPGRSSWH
jgi:hypothetical protein